MIVGARMSGIRSWVCASPRDLMQPYPTEAGAHVADIDADEQAQNDDPSIVEPVR